MNKLNDLKVERKTQTIKNTEQLKCLDNILDKIHSGKTKPKTVWEEKYKYLLFQREIFKND